MKKTIFVLICFMLTSVFLTGCALKNNSQQTIKYQRKLQKYLPANTTGQQGGRIDLSEGPKTKYDTNLGPGELNFDINIKNPYKYE